LDANDCQVASATRSETLAQGSGEGVTVICRFACELGILSTISRKSILGAKLKGFVTADQRETPDFSIGTIARGDKMRAILSIVCKAA